MASIMLPPSHDQENLTTLSVGKLGLSSKKANFKGSAKKMAVNSKMLPKTKLSVGGPEKPRTFGDISNRLNSRSNSSSLNTPLKSVTLANRKQILKPQQPYQATLKSVSKKNGCIDLPDDDLCDLLPTINEVEDYSDVLPSHLRLDDLSLRRLAHHWLLLQKPTFSADMLEPSYVPTPVIETCAFDAFRTDADMCATHLEPVSEDEGPAFPDFW